MAAAQHDITIEQGATFQMSLVWKDSTAAPINLTGYSARMQVRRKYSSTDYLLNLVSPTNIVLGGALGTIAVTAAATVTDDLPAKPAVYDLELTSPTGVVTRLIEGSVLITPEVTR